MRLVYYLDNAIVLHVRKTIAATLTIVVFEVVMMLAL